MKRKITFVTSIIALLAVSFTYAAINGISLRYYNKDSNTYVYDIKIGGRTTKLELGGSRTATVTIQVGSNSDVIVTNCGEITVSDGTNIEIKDGCISVK